MTDYAEVVAPSRGGLARRKLIEVIGAWFGKRGGRLIVGAPYRYEHVTDSDLCVWTDTGDNDKKPDGDDRYYQLTAKIPATRGDIAMVAKDYAGREVTCLLCGNATTIATGAYLEAIGGVIIPRGATLTQHMCVDRRVLP